MNILIIGGAGYIGSHMCKCLSEAGHAVVVLDNLVTGHRQAVQWGELVVGDLGDRPLVEGLLASRSIEAVMHFAASSQVGESVIEPYVYYQNNVVATLSLLQAMRTQKVNRLVFSSTAAVYGVPSAALIDENHLRQPINPYGRTKLAVEHMLEDAASAYGLRAVALRYFNAAGADDSGLIGEAHEPETHLIPRLLRKATGESIDVRIFGRDYPTPDGTCIRDYVHVCDLAEAHLSALEHTRHEEGFDCFNLGNGGGYSVLQVVRAAEEVTGCTLDIADAPRRVGDPAVLVASSQKAQNILGWQPKRASIHQILEDAWRWHRQPSF